MTTGTETPGTGNQGGEPRVFTQEEVNAIAGKARLEERQKYPDYEGLKARAATADKLERDQLTELQQVQHDLAEEQRKNIDAEGRIAAAMITSEIRVRATQKGIVDPDAAVALVNRGSIGFADETGVSGVDAALDALLAAKPYLKGQMQTPNLNPGGGPAAKIIPLTQEEREVAGKLGLTDEQYSKRKV